MFIPFILFFVSIMLSTTADADERTPVGIGPHSRIWSGLGSTAARGGESVQYNPANLVLSSPLEIQYELTAINLNYKYSYTGFPEVQISKTTAIPFLGASGKIGSNFAFGGYVLPIPEASEATELENVPTRKLSATPVSVNAKQSGNGLGIKSGFGSAYKINSNFALGVGLMYEKSGTNREVFAPGINVKVQSTKTSSNEILLRLGGRYSSSGLVVSLATVAYGTASTKGSEETLGVAGTATKSVADSTSYPVNVNSGIAWKLSSFSLLGDVSYHQWTSTVDLARSDLFSTIDFMIGGRFELNKSSAVLGNYAFFPGYKGDGLLASSSPDGLEVNGMEIGEIDAMTRNSVTGAYEFVLLQNRSSVFLNYQFGSRTVFADGVSAGDHDLKIIYLGFASQYKVFKSSVVSNQSKNK